ncbi:hypothetical protein IscW_ISCW000454, partial [Ixodes scapularis]
ERSTNRDKSTGVTSVRNAGGPFTSACKRSHRYGRTSRARRPRRRGRPATRHPRMRHLIAPAAAA